MRRAPATRHLHRPSVDNASYETGTWEVLHVIINEKVFKQNNQTIRNQIETKRIKVFKDFLFRDYAKASRSRTEDRDLHSTTTRSIRNRHQTQDLQNTNRQYHLPSRPLVAS